MSQNQLRRTGDTFRTAMLIMAAIQIGCAVIFVLDLILEIPAGMATGELGAADAVHFATEALAVLLLFAGFWIARRGLADLARERDVQTGRLRSLRGEFDRILNAHFDAWMLTPAQRDVALLTLRGLRISEIAAARGTAEGTVKAQMSAVFRAAGVRTRGELTGLFMDEFLDFAATTAPPPAPPPALAAQ